MRNINQIMSLAQELAPFFSEFTPRKHQMSEILAGIIWILVTGAQWSFLPKGLFPPKSTCYYWYVKFRKKNLFGIILFRLSSSGSRKNNSIEEAYIDASFTEAKTGGEKVGGTKAGKGSKLFAVLSRDNRILHLSLESATHHESQFALSIVKKIQNKLKPKNLIGDKAYSSFPLKNSLDKLKVKLIAPDKINRIHNKQDGRSLRRYKRRHKIENYFADLQTFRKVVTRYERISENYLAFVKLAAICFNFWKFKKQSQMVV